MNLFRLILRCVFCAQPAGPERICDRCLAVFPWNEVYCVRCGQPAPGAVDTPCGNCQQKPPVFTLARAPLLYEFPVDSAIKKLKFSGQTMYAPALADLMLDCLHREFAHCDALVPVPLHRWRHIRRGFNQAREIARPLARATGLPLFDRAIRRHATRPQAGLNAAERQSNLRDAFVAGKGFCYRQPLIIDDVITTGTTANHLAHALLEAGAERVDVLAAARA